MILTEMLLYSRSIISMLYLGQLGELALVGGSLAIGFANITVYSILSGLSKGRKPICGQAFGSGKLTHQEIATMAQTYLLYSLPDLLAQSFLHPLRIYLCSQSITLSLTFCASLSIILHIPINYLLVTKLGLGIEGVALSSVLTKFNSVDHLHIDFCGIQENMGRLLMNPRAAVASIWIFIQTTALFYIFPSSLSFSVSTRVGNELGAGRPGNAKLAAIVGLCFSFVLGASALFFATRDKNLWAVMFTQDKEIIALTSLVLPIIRLCELGNCPQTTECNVLRWKARGLWCRDMSQGKPIQGALSSRVETWICRYVGEFKWDVKHGLGHYHFRNGDIYAGEYFADKMHGFGVYSFANGRIYQGSWHEGRAWFVHFQKL
ncbi:hypothetical protein L1887_01086 [Cichorium endivia]|nr:hypothetical protein L1887_01086 [Cichorium endivia]